MSKRDLKKYIHGLSKDQLEDQILELYSRFKEVKVYYDFAFNPREDKLMEAAKFKISKEYFPVTKRKAKLRRSVAQKLIKHFILLGVDANLLADLMLYSVEIAQTYTANKPIKQVSFYPSMLKSFEQAFDYVHNHGLKMQFIDRMEKIVDEAENQNWINYQAFDTILDRGIN